MKEIDNDLEVSMYEYIIEFLKLKDYIYYEILNFFKKDFELRYNFIYWENKKYLGVGLLVVGYLNNVRYKNFFNLKDYYNNLDRNILFIDEKEIFIEEDIE